MTHLAAQLPGGSYGHVGRLRSSAHIETPVRVLVVDDEEIICTLLTQILTGEGYEVVTASGGREAMDLLAQERFDAVITDMLMPDVPGVEVVRAAKRIDPMYPVMAMTGYPSAQAAADLRSLGVSDYIAKPFKVDLIITTVARLVQTRGTD
ncbi:MAG: response regulator [Chloroflexi bacterium]|nr:response regulator [Chloroflexota bacterium]